ncbi:MAG: hypothetical protein ACO2OZ_08370 [Acidilobaceae archaeon]
MVNDVLGKMGGLTMLAIPTGRMGVLLVRLVAMVAIALTLTSLITSMTLQLALVGGGEP